MPTTIDPETTESAIEISADQFDIAIHNVVVTVKSRQTGDHRTFKIKTVLKDTDWANGRANSPFIVKAGTRYVSLLIGPDREDESSWRRFGFVGHTGIVSVFRNLRGTEFDRFALMLANPKRFASTAEFLLLAYCSRCNRPLSHPESITSGMGPICREKI